MKTTRLLWVVLMLVPMIVVAQNKYIGAKMCKACHQNEKQGKQFPIWEKSAHAGAFKTLTGEKSAAIAKEKGLEKSASEAPECLECHAPVVDPKVADKGYNAADGVQCETCHGAGSAYKTMAIMKDHAKSVAAGMTEYKDDAAIEAQCKTCHNEKSPTYKEFKFAEMWEKIKHEKPN